MSYSLLRDLIREEIRKLIQDDAIFHHHDNFGLRYTLDTPGLEPEFNNPGDECPNCEKTYPARCPKHNIVRVFDQDQ